MIKINTIVNTPDGQGVVKDIESNGFIKLRRYGVLHDIFPTNRIKMYKNNILYYFTNEVSQ